MPLISTMRGREPANNVPATERVSLSVSIVTRTSVWYSLGRSCTVSATSMPWSRAATPALTMLTPSIIGDIRPASTAAVSGRGFSSGDLAFVLDRDATDDALARLGELAGEPAEQPAEFHVGLQPRGVLGRDRRHVDRVGNGAGQQEVAHLFGDLQGDVLLCLGRGGAEMRGADDVVETEQGRVDGRLGFEHIERGAGDVAGPDRVGQRGLIQQAAAGAVDDAHALPGLRQRLAREDVARGVGQRRVQGDDVGARQQRVELDLLHAERQRPLLRQIRIVGDDTHLQSRRRARRRSSRCCRNRSGRASCRSARRP